MLGGSHANSVSDDPFPQLVFRSLSSIRNRLLCNEDSLKNFVYMGSTLDSVVQAQSCLSSILIGCAVDAIDAQLGLGTDLHHRMHHSWIRKQEERQGTPKNPHVMDIVTGREEVCNCNLRLTRISIIM